MRTSYDEKADTFYITTEVGASADYVQEYTSDILFRYKNNTPIGITVLNYSFHDDSLLEELIYNELGINFKF